MRRALFIAALIVAAALARADPAMAHAVLEGSTPGAGAQVDSAPAELVLDFTEGPDRALASVQVLDEAGSGVGAGDAVIDPADPTVVRVSLPALEDGSYTVTWRVTSVEDGHTTAGSFAFGVGQPPSEAAVAAAAEAPGTPTPGATGVVGRTALYLGVVGLLGLAALRLFVVRGEDHRMAPGPGPWLLVGVWAVALAGVALVVVDEADRSGASLADLLRSDVGDRLILLAVAVVMLGFVVALHGSLARPWADVALGIAAAGVLLARAAGGHAASSSLAVAVQWVHLAAVGVWLGGLAWLVAAIHRLGSSRGVAVAGRFSRMATVALALVVATGTLRAVDEVGGWDELLDSGFGQALLVKLVIVALVVALAVAARGGLRRAGSPGWIRLAGGEVSAGAAVLVATAFLAGLAPGSTTAAPPAGPPAPPEPLVVEGSDFATSVRVTLTADPGTVGQNSFSLDGRDYDTDAPVEARAVSLRFRLPGRPSVPATTVAMVQAADGGWEADAAVLSVMGTWEVAAVITTTDGGVEVPLRLRPRLAGQRVESLETPGQPTLYTVVLPEGERVQGYADPGTSGFNEVHVTAFTPEGGELALTAATVVATGPDGREVALEVRRFGPGHYVAEADLGPGRWDFLATLQVQGSGVIMVDFPSEIG